MIKAKWRYQWGQKLRKWEWLGISFVEIETQTIIEGSGKIKEHIHSERKKDAERRWSKPEMQIVGRYMDFFAYFLPQRKVSGAQDSNEPGGTRGVESSQCSSKTTLIWAHTSTHMHHTHTPSSSHCLLLFPFPHILTTTSLVLQRHIVESCKKTTRGPLRQSWCHGP